MLGVTTNVSSLVAQNSLARTSTMLSVTLKRLSTGLKINSGADGPAALVISQEQQAQIAGLQAAITNTDKATSLVQTAEGALSTINDLLNQMRALAIDSANTGVNDATALAANQAEVTNALSTIDRIAKNTQFGTKRILDGSAGFNGVSNNSNITFIGALASQASAGNFAINITRAAQRASVTASAAQTGPLAANESLTINGVTIGLTAGQTQAQVINTINTYTNQTGVVAESFGTGVTGATPYTVTSGGTTSPATLTTQLNSLNQNTTAYAAGASLDISGVDGDGTTIATTNVALANGANATLGDVVNAINGVFQHAVASLDANGNIVLSAKPNDPLATNQNFALTIADHDATKGATTWAPLTTASGATTRLRTIQFGSAASITVSSNLAATATSSGFGAGGTPHVGVDVAGTIGGAAAQGNGNILTGNPGAAGQGISISAGLAANDTVSSVSGAQGAVIINDNQLVFQIGANANQTVKVGVDNVGTAALGLNVFGDQFANLGQINIQSQSGSQDAIKVIDAAIGQVSQLRGQLGAIQAQTLSYNSSNLQTTLENTTSAESVIRDTDFAAETANYSKYQILMQVGTSVLQNSNQTAGLVVKLFQ
jgi:flagellin